MYNQLLLCFIPRPIVICLSADPLLLSPSCVCPVAWLQAGYASGVGHSARVTNVRFDLNDRFAFTVGGTDRCLFQWKLTERK